MSSSDKLDMSMEQVNMLLSEIESDPELKMSEDFLERYRHVVETGNLSSRSVTYFNQQWEDIDKEAELHLSLIELDATRAKQYQKRYSSAAVVFFVLALISFGKWHWSHQKLHDSILKHQAHRERTASRKEDIELSIMMKSNHEFIQSSEKTRTQHADKSVKNKKRR